MNVPQMSDGDTGYTQEVKQNAIDKKLYVPAASGGESGWKPYETIAEYEFELGDVNKISQTVSFEPNDYRHIVLICHFETTGTNTSVQALDFLGVNLLYYYAFNTNSAYPLKDFQADFYPTDLDGNKNSALVTVYDGSASNSNTLIDSTSDPTKLAATLKRFVQYGFANSTGLSVKIDSDLVGNFKSFWFKVYGQRK